MAWRDQDISNFQSTAYWMYWHEARVLEWQDVARGDDLLWLKKDRTGTYQGSSANPECGLSCPSAEGFTVLSYGDGHFRAGSHFLYVVFLFLLEMSPQTFDQGPVSRHFWTVNSVWHFVKLRCSRCLLFFANKYTWVHRSPSTRHSFLLCEEN